MGSETTSFLEKLLELKIKRFTSPQKELHSFSQLQHFYAMIKDVEFQLGLPDVEELLQQPIKRLQPSTSARLHYLVIL